MKIIVETMGYRVRLDLILIRVAPYVAATLVLWVVYLMAFAER